MAINVKKIREQSKLLKSANRNIERLEHMLDSVSGQVQDVVNMKDLLRTAAVKVGVMKDTLGELDSRYDRIKQDKETIESHTRDTEELKRVLASVQGDYEKLLGQSHMINETQETLHSLMQQISELKIESKNMLTPMREIEKLFMFLKRFHSLTYATVNVSPKCLDGCSHLSLSIDEPNPIISI